MRMVSFCATLGLLLTATDAAVAQPAPAPFIVTAYEDLISERMELTAEAEAERFLDLPEGVRIIREDVGDPAGAWVIVRFATFNLGDNSQLTVSSLQNPEQVQTFTHVRLAALGGESARFNGGEVRIELIVFPDDGNVFYEIDEFLVGQHLGDSPIGGIVSGAGQPEPESICGADDRVRSFDERVGRIMPAGCTGWTLDDGVFLTAGHCVGPRMRLLEFQIPPSLPDGTPQSPLVEHQFTIVRFSIESEALGIGRDWAVFSVVPNEAGMLPHQIYGSFDVTRVDEDADIVVRGYGLDDDPVGSAGAWNSDNQTQQEDTGALNDVTSPVIEHYADTRRGNSGSPVFFDTAVGKAIGIHTHGGCARSTNHGTSFMNEDLWLAISQ